MAENKLNWGIVGTGWIAHEMAAALNAVNGEVYAAVAIDAKAGEDFQREFGVGRIYASNEELMADPNVDIVYVATPHTFHYEIMKMALLAGKHVFSEKSVTVNDRQLEECVAIAKEKGLVICDGVTLLHMPLFKELGRIVKSGELGPVRMIQLNFGSFKEFDVNNRFFSKQLAGGALLDIGVYATSFARFFMQSAPNVVLTTANFLETGVDETSGIILKNREGEMAVMSLTLRAKQPKRGIVACEKGYIEVMEYPRAAKATITLTETGEVRTIEAGESDRALQYEVMDMQDYVLNGTGDANLQIIRDVMATLTAVRSQWGMVYPFE